MPIGTYSVPDAAPVGITENPKAPSLLPPSFLLGVSDSGYQTEGGFNGPGQPRNNWANWELEGRAPVSGLANNFWNDYQFHFDHVVKAGCNGYRMSIEWARCETSDGTFDQDAIDHYVRILRAARERGIEPVVTLSHFTHPGWLGEEFWLESTSADRFRRWAKRIVPEIAPYCTKWVTVNEINVYGIGSYLVGYFPPGKYARTKSFAMTTDNMLAAHVAAYEVIHDEQPDAKVGTPSYTFSAYDSDRIFIDVLLARHYGVGRNDLQDWLAHRREEFHIQVAEGLSRLDVFKESLIQQSLKRVLRIDKRFDSAIEAVYSSPYDKTVDVIQMNFYDPQLSLYPRLPGRMVSGERVWKPDPKHWEQRISFDRLAAYLRANEEPGMELWILENGICNRVSDGVSYPRPDGFDRPAYMKGIFAACIEAIEAGVELTAYFAWTLGDNYQWGGYEGRYGIFGTEREGEFSWMKTDAMGHDSAGTLRRIVEGLRMGDRSVLS